MNTELLPVTPEALARAGALIRAGELVAFPTETVYGLGADAMNADAVRRIFEAKGRPGDNPLIAHISGVEQLAPLIAAEPSPAARALIDAAGRPIAAPSANRSGRPSPTTAGHVWEDMAGRVPLILDGGPCAVGLESTVIDVTGPTPRILRPGGVTPELIERICGAAKVDEAVMRPLREGERPRSPGMKYRHYAPKGALTIVKGEAPTVARRIRALYDAAEAAGERPLILALQGHLPAYGERRALSLGADAEAMAHNMFALLREADELGAERIFSEAVPDRGLGLAVMNRLGRAAAFKIIEV